jgi:hypothetical protein
VLINPDYSKEFLILSFSSFDTLVIVLLQKNIEGLEEPISFFSIALRDAEIRYDIMEKKVYALVNSLQAFIVFVFDEGASPTKHKRGGQLGALAHIFEIF